MQPAVIVEGHPVHHRLPGLFSGRKFPALRADRFSRPRKLYVGALSQQLPFPFIDERMPRSLWACRNSWLQYRLPPRCGISIPVAAAPRHGHRVLDRAGLHMRLQSPAHRLTAGQVNDRRRAQPALFGPDVGDVTTPRPVGLLRTEAPLRRVRRHRQAALAVDRRHVLALGLGANPALPHELARPVFAPRIPRPAILCAYAAGHIPH